MSIFVTETLEMWSCLFYKFSFKFCCFHHQKNPSTIRQPEEDRNRDNYTMTGWVKLSRSMPVSRHISSLCSEAAESTYIRDVDIKTWATRPGKFSSFFSPLFYFFMVGVLLEVIYSTFYTNWSHNSMSALHYRNVTLWTRRKNCFSYLWNCVLSTATAKKPKSQKKCTEKKTSCRAYGYFRITNSQ